MDKETIYNPNFELEAKDIYIEELRNRLTYKEEQMPLVEKLEEEVSLLVMQLANPYLTRQEDPERFSKELEDWSNNIEIRRQENRFPNDFGRFFSGEEAFHWSNMPDYIPSYTADEVSVYYILFLFKLTQVEYSVIWFLLEYQYLKEGENFKYFLENLLDLDAKILWAEERQNASQRWLNNVEKGRTVNLTKMFQPRILKKKNSGHQTNKKTKKNVSHYSGILNKLMKLQVKEKKGKISDSKYNAYIKYQLGNIKNSRGDDYEYSNSELVLNLMDMLLKHKQNNEQQMDKKNNNSQEIETADVVVNSNSEDKENQSLESNITIIYKKGGKTDFSLLQTAILFRLLLKYGFLIDNKNRLSAVNMSKIIQCLTEKSFNTMRKKINKDMDKEATMGDLSKIKTLLHKMIKDIEASEEKIRDINL